MSRTLLIRRQPQRDESLLGYVLALVELNRLNTPSEILARAGLEYRAIAKSCAFLFKPPAALERLAALTGASLPELSALSYARPAGENDRSTLCTFNGRLIHQYYLRPDQPRFCPRCLAEEGYFRRIWDCLMMTVCPKHACLLVDQCPRCQRPLGWARRRRIKRCACKYNLARTEARPVSEAELVVTGHLHNLFGFEKGDCKVEDDGWNVARQLGTLDFMRAITMVGDYCRDDLRTLKRGRKYLSDLSFEDYHATLLRAHRVFQHWPENFYEFLEGVRSKPKNPYKNLRTGFAKEFGYFYFDLFGKRKSPGLDFMREAFLRYAGQWDGGYVSHLNRRGLAPDAEKYLSKAKVKTLLKRDSRKIAALIQAGVLRVKQSKSGIDLICAEDVYGEKERQEDQIPISSLSRQLKLSYRGIRNLIGKGLLHPVSEVGGKRKLRFATNAGEEFIAKLSSHAQRSTRIPKSERLTLESVNALLLRYGIGRDVFYADICQGVIHPCGAREDEGLAGIEFAIPPVIQYGFKKERDFRDADIETLILSQGE